MSARTGDALPVRLAATGDEAPAIRRWVEGVTGWQAVDEATAPLVPPVLTLADVAGAGEHELTAGPPVVLLVSAHDDPLATARAATAGRAAVVLRWPEERDQLPAVAADLADRDVPRDTRELRVGGAAGGVGTTTVALALAGLEAWRGTSTLVLTHGAVPAPTAEAVAGTDLLGQRTWESAAAVPGVADLRLVRAAAAPGDEPVAAGAAQLVVRDLGVSADAEVLVLRRDAAGLDALSTTTAAVAVLVDTGPAPTTAVRAAAEGRRVVVVPDSVRVARAGLRRRVPAGLPGAWLRALAPAVGRG